MTIETLPIFVYGTLQRGECREKMWPRSPLRVETAFVRGRLYDLGPYPALAPGDDLVRGELWHIAAADLPETLAALDAIEDYADSDDDLYKRAIVECRDERGRACRAYVYLFAKTKMLQDDSIVSPGPEGDCHWSGSERV
jgi:gamma-glutamylcyclotransferase (GGCT)/AIG2-like uncharacterized protein YtfP